MICKVQKNPNHPLMMTVTILRMATLGEDRMCLMQKRGKILWLCFLK